LFQSFSPAFASAQELARTKPLANHRGPEKIVPAPGRDRSRSKMQPNSPAPGESERLLMTTKMTGYAEKQLRRRR
jgi:hypothetical protein